MKFVEFRNRTVTSLLSRDYSTPTKRSVRLLSRDYSTPVNKIIEYLNFFLLCTLLALLCYLYVRMKRYLTLLKMAEASIDNLMSSGYDGPQSEAKKQKLLECILTGNSKLYLGKVTQKNKLTNLAMKKWINSLVITKLSSQDRW